MQYVLLLLCNMAQVKGDKSNVFKYVENQVKNNFVPTLSKYGLKNNLRDGNGCQ